MGYPELGYGRRGLAPMPRRSTPGCRDAHAPAAFSGWRVFRNAVVRIGCYPLSSDRRSIPKLRVMLALAAIAFASLMPAVRAPATPHMRVAAPSAKDLQQQVVRLFDELDEVRQTIETVQAETAWVRERISELSRQIDERQQLLNRRAAEAYMGERAVGFDSVLGAGSLTDLQDSLEFLDAVSQRDHEVLVSLEERKQEVERQWIRLEALEEQLRV